MLARQLAFPITKLKGIGKVSAADFAALGVETGGDLITLYPRDYDDRTVMTSLADLPPEGGTINTIVSITDHGHYMAKGKRVLKIGAKDLRSGRTLYLHCFGRAFMENAYPVGTSWYINASVTRLGSAWSASAFTLGSSEEAVGIGRILPIYPLSGNLSQKTVRKAVEAILSNKYIHFDDEVPDDLVAKHGLMHTDEAIRQLHQPSDRASLDRARLTLAYTELLHLELRLERQREKRAKSTHPPKAGKLEQALQASLPFSLTEDQLRVLDEIREDLDAGSMDRLLQGDVGSGKTLVAWMAALRCIERGFQVAFMAPTELLARQHAEGAAALLEKLGVRVAFLTGDVKGKERGYLLDALHQGGIDLAIGTHALFSKDVAFKRLGLVIIDEQHRFGVEQREALRSKGKDVSLLMMSATPIPRTLAMTVFGSMDISTIYSKPMGRKSIITHIVDEKNRERMYASIGVEFSRGHQAYFVYPRIDDEGEGDLKDVTTMFSFLKEKYPGIPSALIHSRLPEDEKMRILDDFRDKKLMYLVSTSVVEVGIDIKDATCMVIEHAERFGLAALHQLRGRVGRSELQSWCFLVYYGTLTEEAKARLIVMRESNDGFRIAETDLRLRGPGDFIGNRQSGFLRLKVASLVDDVELMAQAKEDAEAIIQEDRGLLQSRHATLRRILSADGTQEPSD